MYINIFKSVAFCQFQKGIEVCVMAVNAAIGEQAVYMQAGSLFLHIVYRFQKCLILKESTALDFL